MADDKKLAELRSIRGAETFSYDPNVPYDRLDDKSISAIAERSGLSEAGRMRVDDIRNSQAEFGPVSIRELGNVIGWFPSRMMRLILQFASVGVEYLALLFLESPIFNPDVIEIWHNVKITDVEYERTKVAVKVNALIVTPYGFFFFEYQRVEDLIDNPRYGKIDGKWDSPKLRVAASRSGIGYQLVTDDEIGQIALANLSDLQKCYRHNYRMPPESVLTYIAQRVETERVVSWRDLNNENISGDAIVCAIALGLVWYPIREWDMSLEVAFVYVDEDAFRQHIKERKELDALTVVPLPKLLPSVGDEVLVDGITYSVVRADSVYRLCCPTLEDIYATLVQAEEACRSGKWEFKDQPARLIYQLSPKQVREGTLLIAEFSKVREAYHWPFGKKKGLLISPTQVRRILARLALAKKLNISPLITLARNHRGNPGARTSEGFAWNKILYEYFLTKSSPTVAAIQKPYEMECEKYGLTPVCLRTMRYRIAALGRYRVILLRKGTFAAYQFGAYVPAGKGNLIVVGRYTGEVAHVDTTPFTNVAIDPFSGLPASRRLSLSMMVESNTDDVVDFVLYYGAASYRAIYRLLRKIVMRTGQLPQYIVFDHGSEHLAKDLQVNLASFGVICLLRGTKLPRAGQPVEGKFSALIRGLLRNLPGFRDPKDKIREIPASHTPKSQAKHTLTEFRKKIAEFFNIARMKPSAKTGGESIERYRARREFERSGHWVQIENVDEFLFTLMPLVEYKGGKRKIEKGGVINQYVTYYNDIFFDPRVDLKYFKVREDPDNIAHVIVELEDAGRTMPGSNLPELPARVIAKCKWYDRYSVFTAEEREEYFEHRRRTTKDSDRLAAMSMDFDLLVELEAHKRTPVGAEMHTVAMQNREIDVSQESLVKLGILNADGSFNPKFVDRSFDDPVTTESNAWVQNADSESSANPIPPISSAVPKGEPLRQSSTVRPDVSAGAAPADQSVDNSIPSSKPTEPSAPSEPVKPKYTPRVFDDI